MDIERKKRSYGGKNGGGNVVSVCNTYRKFGGYYLQGIGNLENSRFNRSGGYKA